MNDNNLRNCIEIQTKLIKGCQRLSYEEVLLVHIFRMAIY